MSPNIVSIRFIIKKYKAKENLVPVYARIKVAGRIADISVKREVDLAVWNPVTGRAKGTREAIKAFNAYLDRTHNELVNCHTALIQQRQPVTAEAIKNLFCGVEPENEEQTLKQLIEYHNTHQKHLLEWGTLKNYFTTQKYIDLFLESRKQKDLPLSKLSYRFLADFERFLKTYQPLDHQRPCGHNTVLKHIERLRKMVNLAIKNEWLDRDPFAKFQARFIKNDRHFLTQQELDAIQNQHFTSARLQGGQDLFIFSCYTGLAYIDVMQLSAMNLTIGIDGERWIATSRKKTKEPVRIPLLPPALAIIEKYKGHPKAGVTGTLFPKISNQKLNAYLKEIAGLCGIEKNLTFHLARHTFATTVTLTNGVPVETVSKMLGHTSIRTTQIYAKVVEKKVSDDMKGLWDKLKGNNNSERKAGGTD